MGDLLGSVIGSAGSIVGDVANLFGQSAANRQAENYNTSMLQMQRQWALQDIQNQNEYNSPVEQMKRLKAAGLNPNLVYGSGVQGATGNQTSQPRASTPNSYNPQNTLSGFKDIGSQLLGALTASQNIEQSQAQTKLLGQSLENLKTEQINTQLKNIEQTITNNILRTEPGANPADNMEGEESVTDLKRSILANHARGEQASAHIAEINEAISAASKESKITDAVQSGIQSLIKSTSDKIAQDNLRQQGEILKKNTDLLQLDIDNANWGLNANSPMWQKVVSSILHMLGGYFLRKSN